MAWLVGWSIGQEEARGRADLATWPAIPPHPHLPPPAHPPTQAFPKQLLLRELPPEMDILCTHPMFGPDSGRGSWAGLNFMYEAVRVGEDPQREARVENFLRVRAAWWEVWAG